MSQKKTSPLSGIQTCWAIVFDAHGDGPVVISAKERLLMRYYRSVLRYLRALVRDPEIAEELTHEFVIRFLRGDLKKASPLRGRFRDLLKKMLRNLAIDYWRRKNTEKKKMGAPLVADCADPTSSNFDFDEDDHAFLRTWRKEITHQAARALSYIDERLGRRYHAILYFKLTHPRKNSAELAALFSVEAGRTYTADSFRQLLRRARERFADLVITEVARSLRTADPDTIENELIELSLHSFCRHSMLRLRRSNFLLRGSKPLGRPSPRK